MLHVQNLSGGYDKKHPAVHDVSFQVEKGSFFALLGPNGSGKTTIIRLLMGVIPISSGGALLDGKPIDRYSSVELAQKVSVLSQENQMGLDFTVEEIVALGRYPYQAKRLFHEESETDREAVKEAMKLTHLDSYKSKPFISLSGGEKQRVLLAKALAQEPELIILDEPTNHLDIKHTLEILDLLKKLQKEKNLTVLAILHDLNIASIYADALGMLKQGKLIQISEGFLKNDEELLRKVYETDLHIAAHPEMAKMQVSFMPRQQITSKRVSTSPFSVNEEKDRLILQFDSQLRTLALGKDGDGLAWSAGMMCTNIISNAEVPEHYIRWEYPESSIECIQEDLLGSSCILMKHWDGAEVHLALFTEFPLSDIDLMNLSISITESRMKLYPVSMTGRIVVGTDRSKRKNKTDEMKKVFLEELKIWVLAKVQNLR
ncbi:iron complex transport system ATP-binding protein [Peribacillus deserti]|uniref:Iron complex transport system ATP-binding protein n=1 Tax=Peribacillus deserti TaxID=673318 RepID=A0ABS2QMI3_9BACI|nr:ABC transporter ATP-binding protein [Peribacillus deserti]MBM7694385.1 iron complex transport system ATP-binding protein [Peribacillus deserti]